MIRTLLTLALLTMPLAACAQDAPPAAERDMPVITGGWSKAALTPEIEAVAVWAFNAMDVPGAELAEIENISQQVVAGMNYRMDLVFTDGRRWRVISGRSPIRARLSRRSRKPQAVRWASSG